MVQVNFVIMQGSNQFLIKSFASCIDSKAMTNSLVEKHAIQMQVMSKK